MTEHFNRRTELAKRRSLRRQATVAEQRLWQALRGGQLGVRFRRQYSVDAYVLDLYAPECKLAIEVDGASHYTTEGIAYDEERTRYLAGFGIEVVRVSNVELLQNLAGVVEGIERTIRQRRETSP